MEGTQSTTTERITGNDGHQDQTVLMASKPLHRFVQREPKTLGIVIVIFGCAELLMGFNLASETVGTSCGIYIPFWQGVLFLVCGNLSIYTEVHPSKKMVTVCLAMYVISILGIIVSAGYRIYTLVEYSFFGYRRYYFQDINSHKRLEQLIGVESILFTSSLCVSGLLIFLCVVARLALTSTRTQIIVQQLPTPSVATSN